MSNGSRSADAPWLQQGGSCRQGGRASSPPSRASQGPPPASSKHRGLWKQFWIGISFHYCVRSFFFPIFISLQLVLSFITFSFPNSLSRRLCTQKVLNRCLPSLSNPLDWRPVFGAALNPVRQKFAAGRWIPLLTVRSGAEFLVYSRESAVCSRSLPRFFTDPFPDLAKEWSRSRGVGVTI